MGREVAQPPVQTGALREGRCRDYHPTILDGTDGLFDRALDTRCEDDQAVGKEHERSSRNCLILEL